MSEKWSEHFDSNAQMKGFHYEWNHFVPLYFFHFSTRIFSSFDIFNHYLSYRLFQSKHVL